MKCNSSIPLALVLALAPGLALAMSQDNAGTTQQPQAAVAPSSALSPIDIGPAVQAKADDQQQPQISRHEQFQSCNRLAMRARNHARSIEKTANNPAFIPKTAAMQHKQLQESLGNLKQEHERLFQSLSLEQQSTVQSHNANLLESHERIQSLVSEMERELSDSVLQTSLVADQARATQREMKAFQKEFRAMGKDLGFKLD